jgi:hypothetical protein
MIVESLKYITPLACDVLACGLIESLVDLGQQRKRTKNFDPTILRSMAQFAGQVFKKYDAEVTGLLQVCNLL